MEEPARGIFMKIPATDLLGDPASLKPDPEKKKYPTPYGYYFAPGTGPAGETCGSCDHCVRKHLSKKNVYKCGLNRENWGGTRRSDIVLRSPACKFWKSDQSTEKRKS
jgi:hypothetical protein